MESEGDDPAFVHRLEKHDAKLLYNLRFQWRKEEYCDLVIQSNNHKSLSMHACVMSAFSPRIASMVSKTNPQADWSGRSPLYTVEVNFSHEVMETVVTALYTGVFQPQTKHLKDVLAAVQWLKIAELILVIRNHVDNEKACREEKENETSNKEDIAQEKSVDEISEEKSSSSAQETAQDPALPGQNTAPEPDDFVNFKEVGDRTNDFESTSDPGVSEVSPRVRKRKLPSYMVRRNILMKNPKIDRVDHDTLDAIVKLEVDSSCTVNFDNSAEPAGSSEGNELYPFWNVGTRGRKTTRKYRSARPQVKLSGERPRRGRKPKAVAAKEKVPKEKKPPKSTGKSTRGRKKGSTNQTSRRGRRKSVPKKKLSVTEEDAEEAELDPSLIEEVDQNDPVKDELDFLMGNISFLKCKKCNEKFTNLEAYHQHMVNHPDYKCPECQMIFFNKAFLTRHIRSTHARADILKCRHCGFQAQTQVMLQTHCDKEHQDDKPFSCPHEGCQFRSRKYDRIHKHLIVHSDQKEFMCDKCSQSFARQISLILHQRACYNTQEFLCDLCGQAFNHCHSMRKHRQTIHFGEKKYKCHVCDTAFSDHRNLSRHMRIHNNSFPYSCAICQQKYRHSNSLKAHLASKHSDLPEELYQAMATPSNTPKLGGASYKRVLKNDHINAITSRVDRGQKNSSKKRASNVKRELTSPSQVYPGSFSREFMMPQDESNFDASNSNDMELVIETPQAIQDLSCMSRPLDLNGDGQMMSGGHEDGMNSSKYPLGSGVPGRPTSSSLYSGADSPHVESDQSSIAMSRPMGNDTRFPGQPSPPQSTYKMSSSDKSGSQRNQASSYLPGATQDPNRSQFPTLPDNPFLFHPPFLGGSNYFLAAQAHLAASHNELGFFPQPQPSPAHRTTSSMTGKSMSPSHSHHPESRPSPSPTQHRSLSSVTQSSGSRSWAEMSGHMDKLNAPNQMGKPSMAQQPGMMECHGHPTASSPNMVQPHKKAHHFFSQDPSYWASDPLKGDHSSKSPRGGVGTSGSNTGSAQDRPLNVMKN